MDVEGPADQAANGSSTWGAVVARRLYARNRVARADVRSRVQRCIGKYLGTCDSPQRHDGPGGGQALSACAATKSSRGMPACVQIILSVEPLSVA